MRGLWYGKVPGKARGSRKGARDKRVSGATPGPAVGIQINELLAFCNWGNRANCTFGQQGCKHGEWGHGVNFGNFLTFSKDWGKTWEATEPVSDQGWNVRSPPSPSRRYPPDGGCWAPPRALG